MSATEPDGGATAEQLEWAHRYDGYRRLAASPDALEELLRGAREVQRRSGHVPGWCGVDFLRGWAFYLVRADHHAGGGTLGREWTAVLAALAAHPDAGDGDRPPVGAAPAVPLPTSFSTAPKQHRDAAFLAAKQARFREPHVAPVNDLADRIRQEIADRTGEAAHVPYVDPDSGGIRARVLFLLESPAGPAALGSGMLSADNDDETAKNVWLAYRASGMPRTYGLHWNAVPWYVGTGRKNASVRREQVEQGRAYLLQLLDLAPDVRVILALGRHAQTSVAGAAAALERRGVRVIAAPHPGPIPANVTGGRSLVEVGDCVARALALADGGRDQVPQNVR